MLHKSKNVVKLDKKDKCYFGLLEGDIHERKCDRQECTKLWNRSS